MSKQDKQRRSRDQKVGKNRNDRRSANRELREVTKGGRPDHWTRVALMQQHDAEHGAALA